MDEASERGRAGEIDLGVGHTEVSARDGSGEPLRGNDRESEEKETEDECYSGSIVPHSHTATSLPATVSARSSHHSDLPVSQLSTQLRQGQGHEQLIFTFASAELMPNS